MKGKRSGTRKYIKIGFLIIKVKYQGQALYLLKVEVKVQSHMILGLFAMKTFNDTAQLVSQKTRF